MMTSELWIHCRLQQLLVARLHVRPGTTTTRHIVGGSNPRGWWVKIKVVELCPGRGSFPPPSEFCVREMDLVLSIHSVSRVKPSLPLNISHLAASPSEGGGATMSSAISRAVAESEGRGNLTHASLSGASVE